MKLTKTVLAIASLSLSTFTFADVNLKVVPEISIIAVNGEEIGLMALGSGGGEEVLPNGLNQVVVRVSKLIRQSDGQLDKFNSTPVVITFNSSDKDIELSFDQKMDDYNHANAFESNPSYNLSAVDGSSLQYHQEVLPRGPGLIRNYEKDIASYNVKRSVTLPEKVVAVEDSIKPLEMTTSEGGKVVRVKASTKEVKPMPNLGVDTVNELKSKFSGLNEEQRKQFLTWAVSQ